MQEKRVTRSRTISRRLPAVTTTLALGVAAGAVGLAPSADAAIASVPAALETQAFAGSGDVADDTAIWVNAANPSASLVVGTNKAASGGGIALYDLSGRLLQFRKDGAMNNVDLRSGVPIGGRATTVVTATNRTSKTLAFYRLDPATRTLQPISARSVTVGFEPYGSCMYRSAKSGKLYAFVSSASGGKVEQYELFDNGGKVDAKRVRTLFVGSLSEGCVADDQLGVLYIGEEDKGIWKYGAEPSAGTSRTAVGKVGDGRLVADVEGLSIAAQPSGGGFLLASSQGNSTFAVYERATGRWVRSFKVDGDGRGVDAVTGTDGIDVTTADLGPAFPNGLLVVHDTSNTGASTSNYKFVDLSLALGGVASPTAVPEPAPAPSAPAPAPTTTVPAPQPEPTAPAPEPTAPAPQPSSGSWWGWDPASTAVPPLLPALPWHNNTGLFRAEDRAALVPHAGDFTTTANNQVIDMRNITGNVIVKHTGVVIKRSWVHGRIENATSSPVRAIHIDLGDGKPGDYMKNGTKGSVHLYRSNVFGVTDAIQTTPGKDFVLQDNFIHDLRYAHDSGQSGGNTHNDGFQVNSTGASGVIKHNTFWMWSMNNYSASESATRSSGPHWTDKGDALSSTGYSGGSGSPANGMVNAGIMVGGGNTWNPTLLIEGNLFRGHTYYDLNVQSGNIRVLNNIFSQQENVKGRGDIAGRANIDQWSGNRSYETGALLP